MACADREGSTEFFIGHHHHVSSLLKEWAHAEAEAGANTVHVPTTTLDTFFAAERADIPTSSRWISRAAAYSPSRAAMPQSPRSGRCCGSSRTLRTEDRAISDVITTHDYAAYRFTNRRIVTNLPRRIPIPRAYGEHCCCIRANSVTGSSAHSTDSTFHDHPRHQRVSRRRVGRPGSRRRAGGRRRRRALPAHQAHRRISDARRFAPACRWPVARAVRLDHVAVSRNPRAHLWRKAAFALRHRPQRGLRARPRRELSEGAPACPTPWPTALGCADGASAAGVPLGRTSSRRIWPARSSSRRSTRRPSAPLTASATSSARRGPSAAARR